MAGLPDNLQPTLLHVAVIASSYNNVAALPTILAAIREFGLATIVVNDGSTNKTCEFLSGCEADDKHRVMMSNARKRGKAATLSRGFSRARELGFSHALTIDTTGQYDPADIPVLLAMCLKNPAAIVLGDRNTRHSDYPRKQLVGRKISNILVWLVSGLSVADSQCRLRVYPLEAIARIYPRPIRSTFETEILAYAGFAGLPVVRVPVRFTHPRSAGGTDVGPWTALLQAAGMHLRLLVRSLWPMRFATLNGPSAELETGTIFDRLLRWCSPARTWRKLRYDIKERDRLASSVGWGAFMSFQPYFGFKTLMCLTLAKVFRLQPLVVIGVSSLTSPPIGLIAWTVSIAIGHWLLHGSRLLPAISFDHGPTEVLRRMAVEWCVGGLVMGCVVGPTMAIISRHLLHKLPLTSNAQGTSNVLG